MHICQRLLRRSLFFCAALVFSQAAFASTIQGTVADPLGARIAGAEVQLIARGVVVAHARSGADGGFSLDAPEGRYTLVVQAAGFDSQQSESFFVAGGRTAAPLVTLSPAHVNDQVTVTATGLPTPRAQVSSAVTVLGQDELQNQLDVTEPLSLSPGVTVVQQGQRGGITSLFIRGGDSDSNKVLINGVEAADVGGRYDYSTVTASDLGTIEIYRGADSVLYGSDAMAGVVSMNTKQGTSVTPIVHYASDGGNFGTVHAAADISGAEGRLDYFAGVAGYNTGNALPNDAFRDTTAAANAGYTLPENLQLRGTIRYSNSGAGVPNAWNFYGIADEAHQGDQDFYATGVIDQQTTERWHNLVRYGAARKREQYADYANVGIPVPPSSPFYDYGGYTTGNPVTIRGANGYSVSGQAILDFGCFTTPCSSDLEVSNRDQVDYQSSYRISSHMVGLFGFDFQDERGLSATDYSTNQAARRNYDYTLQFSGDIKNRLFYSLGGGVQKNEIFGLEGTPRVGLAYYLVRPGDGAFQGTKLMGNFSKGVQEPSLSAQTQSLFETLAPLPNGPQLIQQYGIAPIGAERSRGYDGGVEQLLLHQRVVLRARYFHNEFGNEVEYVYTQALSGLVPADVVNELLQAGVYGAYINSLSFSAQGAETEVEAQVSRDLFVRAGYTYLDAKVQRSFSSDALSPAINPAFPEIPIGAIDPLVGARPFRRPPHTGFFIVSYRRPRWFVALKGNIVSRSDDSTFQLYNDVNGGNSLLLPNRNLDASYQRIDFSGEYQLKPWMSMYAQLDNLLSQQDGGVIGYPSLPFTFRSGLKLRLGGKGQ